MEKNNLTKKIILSCFLSSFLEIYDFAIFGFLTKTIYSNYLSFLNRETALIATYAFFAIGFLFRPLGSIIFGYIGDVYGRKIALVTSVSIMGIASLTMFILPSYASIGIISCYIIILVRIIQGISVGGEFTGAIIYAVEHSNKYKAGVVAGIISAGGACGVLLANLVSNIVQNPMLPDYSWRFAFLLGFGLSMIGYFIRKNLSETPVFQNIIVNKTKIPLIEGIKLFKIECFATIWASAANGVIFYFGTIYLVKLLEQNIYLENTQNISVIFAIIVAICVPIFGMISDKINRNNFLIYSSFIMGLYILIILNIILNIQSIYTLIAIIFVYGIIASMIIGTINIFVIEIFPVKYRYSCCSLFYSLGMGFIGGTVPMVSSYIITNYGYSYLSIYISSVCFMACFSVYLVKKKKLTFTK